MCGRFTLAADRRTIVEGLDVDAWEDTLESKPRYNVAPTQTTPIVLREGERRVVRGMRWGLVPSWAKDLAIGAKMINARAETLTEKRSFKGLVPKRRCVVVTDGFYEWKKEGTAKVPHWIHDPDGGLLPMAGLWTTWRPQDAEPVETFTIVTTAANDDLAPVHHRMPVILSPGSVGTWLDTEGCPTDEAMALATPYAGPLTMHPVAKLVNNVRNDHAELIREVTPLVPEPEKQPGLFD